MGRHSQRSRCPAPYQKSDGTWNVEICGGGRNDAPSHTSNSDHPTSSNVLSTFASSISGLTTSAGLVSCFAVNMSLPEFAIWLSNANWQTATPSAISKIQQVCSPNIL
jgi:hypothetical protein